MNISFSPDSKKECFCRHEEKKARLFFDPTAFFVFSTKVEDPFLWKNFQKKLLQQSFEAQEKVRQLFERCGVDTSKGFVQKKYIDLACILLHTMYVSDLGDDVKKMPPSKVADKIEALLQMAPPLPRIEEGKLCSFEVYKTLWQDALSRELEKNLFIKELSLIKSLPAYWEFFTKQVASRNLEEGMIISSLEGKDFYYVYRKIQKKGLIGYALKPLYEASSLKPVLFFRPTQLAFSAEDMLATLMDNLQAEGVGHGGFQAALSDLENLMEDPEFRKPEQTIILAGYSLAGAYAQRFLAHQENWKHVSEAWIFNAPGVESKVARSFAAKVNKESSSLPHTPAIAYFRTEGDPADQVGDVHLGRGVLPSSNMQIHLTKIVPENALDGLATRHMACYLQTKAQVQTFDVKHTMHQPLLDNHKRSQGQKFWEKMRKAAGSIFRPVYAFFLFLQSLWMKYLTPIRFYLSKYRSKQTLGCHECGGIENR